jgi:hypothetical protein
MTMSVFDLLFLLLALAAVIALATAAVQAIRGRLGLAMHIVRRILIAAAGYLAIVAAVAWIGPRREYRVGERRCFDDWCIVVVGAHPRTTATGVTYQVSLELSNRGKGRAMGEKGTVVYLLDSLGRRFDPMPDRAALPFDTLLQPGESRTAERRFDVPSEARGFGLVYTHEGGFPIAWLVIGEGGWLQPPPIVRLD